MPLITLTSKKRSQSSSGISTKGLGSKMPALLTRISTSRQRLNYPRRACGGADIAGNALHVGPGHCGAQFADRVRHPLLGAAVDPHRRSLLQQAAGDGVADTRGRAGYESSAAGETKIHLLLLQR